MHEKTGNEQRDERQRQNAHLYLDQSLVERQDFVRYLADMLRPARSVRRVKGHCADQG